MDYEQDHTYRQVKAFSSTGWLDPPFRDRVRSTVKQEGRRVELLRFYMKKSQLSWFGDLVRMIGMFFLLGGYPLQTQDMLEK